MNYEIKLKRNGGTGVSESELLGDLRAVSKKLRKRSFSMQEYNKVGNFHSSTYKRKIGWNKALEKAGLEMLKRGNDTVTAEMLFKNLSVVWERIGKQPSQGNLDDKRISEFSSGYYKKEFETYNNALLLFTRWANKEKTKPSTIKNKRSRIPKHKTHRNVSVRLRYLVMKRDHFKCQAEWHIKSTPRSPAEDPNVILEIDHKKAWSKGGETVLENLRTLCSECNKAKSNL